MNKLPSLVAALVLTSGCYSGLSAGRDSVGGDGEGGSADDGADGGADGGADDGVDAEYDPAPVRLRVLLSRQYTHAIRDLLGDAAAAQAQPPKDVAINGFDAVGASQLAFTDNDVDTYELSARAVAQAAVEDGTKVAGYHACVPAGADDATCMREFVTNFGRLAFRRSLTEDEITAYTEVGRAAGADLGSFDAGVQTAIATFLQSPNFLYQVEVGEPADTGGMRRLTGIEMATRLAFFVADTTPDAALLDLAEAGGLDDADGVREAVLALLERPEARQSLADFAAEVYRLRELPNTPKDPTVFPDYTTTLSQSMAKETLALLSHLVWEEDADVRDLLDAPYTFVDGSLAAHYALPNPEQYGDTFTMVTLPPEQKRGGILGHAGLLSLLAHVTTTSPTYRGKFVRQQLMCQSIPAPPANVDTTLPDSGEYKTMRERLEIHMSNESCAACHKLFDPIGLGLENYDGVGVFRTLDNGAMIDPNSDLDGTPFDGAASLGAALRDDPSVPRCLVRNLFRHASGHIELASEAPELDKLDAAFADAGYRMKDLYVELVTSPAFRMVGEPE